MLHGTVSKINDIIDSVLQAGVQRVDDALYELDSSMQAGNQNASPPYVLSQIEKASASATEFSTAFNNFIADGPNSPHAEIIRTVSVFSGSVADTLSNTKGLSRFANDDKGADQLFGAARKSAQATVRFFRGLQSFRIEGMDAMQKTDVVINNNLEVQRDLQSLSKLVESFTPKSSKINAKGDLGDLVDQELLKAADAIDAAAQRLAKLKNKPRDGYSTYELRINDAILAAAIAVTNAIAELIKAATESQQEIVREGRGSSSKTAFYKKNNRWTEGLISAAKAVAQSTNTLIETADGVISGRNSPEQLIVASNDVAASTAQLVAASRVKATFMSKTQDRLETASKTVGAACRALVRQVQDIIKEKNSEGNEAEDYTKLSSHEFKVREMEQQVCKMPAMFAFTSYTQWHPLYSFTTTDKCFAPRSKSSSSKTTCPEPEPALEKCARSPTKKTKPWKEPFLLCLCNNFPPFAVYIKETIRFAFLPHFHMISSSVAPRSKMQANPISLFNLPPYLPRSRPNHNAEPRGAHLLPVHLTSLPTIVVSGRPVPWNRAHLVLEIRICTQALRPRARAWLFSHKAETLGVARRRAEQRNSSHYELDCPSGGSTGPAVLWVEAADQRVSSAAHKEKSNVNSALGERGGG